MIKKVYPRRLAAMVLALPLLLALLAGHALAGRYSDYANGLNRNPPEGSAYRPDLEALLAELANGYRSEKGRKPLIADDEFIVAARAHAADMMIHDFVGHRASTGQDFDSRMRSFVDDITRFPAMAENAARDSQKTPVDSSKARSLFQQWVKSSGHRRALTSRNYAYVSTGVIQRGNKIWAVQIFWASPRAKGMFPKAAPAISISQ